MGSIPIRATNSGPLGFRRPLCILHPHLMRFLRPALLLTAFLAGSAVSLTAQDPNAVAIEALQRLKGNDLESNPALKGAVNKVLNQITNQSAFVELVRDFDLKERAPEVLDFVRRHPGDALCLDGLQFVLKYDSASVTRALEHDEDAPNLLVLLGKTGRAEAVPSILAVVKDGKRSAASREAAVRALASTQEGAKQLLVLVGEKGLPEALAILAVHELQAVRWPVIREQALKMGASPVTAPPILPPKGELLKIPGDPERGARIFRKPEVGCMACHQVNGEGVDFGPRLSEIGAKLGKDAIYDSIVDPSAGISFGFESWLFTLKDGDETLGLISSETENEVVVRLQGGQTTRLAKKDLLKREKQAQSIMPTGLQDNLGAQGFADLLEYLSTLKKATR